MIRSMTGFGRYEETLEKHHILVEIKSVNHKYFEFNAHIPKDYSYLEDKLKSYIQEKITRGKVDLYLDIESLEENSVHVTVNQPLAKGYVDAINELSEKYNLYGNISIEVLSKFQDIFNVHTEPEDEDKILTLVISVLEHAVDSFVAMREKEGKKLSDDIVNRADDIYEIVTNIEKRSPETVNEYQIRLENKLKEILEDKSIDEQRIVTEAAIFADRIAVDEETVRLKSHLNQFKELIGKDEPVGRKMDFLVQEMNREANTIGSKASDAQIAYMVVDIKSQIEKIREQIQNIE
jgi:uncharacterized protein (TIGR00255 family)